MTTIKIESRDDYVESLLLEIQTLKIENYTLKTVKDKLEENNLSNEYKAVCYDRFITRQTLCKDRLMFCVSFLQSCDNFSCIYGSTVRKMFELIFQSNNFEANNSLGDMFNSDINILYNYEMTPDKVSVSTAFYNLLHSLEMTRTISDQPNSDIKVPMYGGYKLSSINSSLYHISNDDNIPKAKLIFTKGNDIIYVNMICWRYKEIVDFSVNNFVWTNNGIQPLFNYTFYNYIENIYFQESKYLYRPEILQNDAFPTHISLTRKNKVIYLNKMYDLIGKRILKLLPSNYKIINNPTRIESLEDCHITGCKAPYPYIKLICGHKLSLMAYKGILHKTNDDDTQSLRCPFCRSDLKIQFHNGALDVEHNYRYKLLDLNYLIDKLNIKQNVLDSKFISFDAVDQL